MLCTAHHCYGDAEQKSNVPYKQAHLNHPSTIWARRSKLTYMWLYDHMIALGKEYTKRYGKQHLTIIKCRDFLSIPPKYIQGNEWVEPPDSQMTIAFFDDSPELRCPECAELSAASSCGKPRPNGASAPHWRVRRRVVCQSDGSAAEDRAERRLAVSFCGRSGTCVTRGTPSTGGIA